MSTIYEALRKAEERRRLGEAPALIGDAAWAARRPPHAAPSRRLWLWLLLPAVLAGLAGAWWLGRGSGAAPSAPTGAAPAPAAAAAAAAASTPAPSTSGSTAPGPVAVAPAQAVVANDAATPVAPAAAPAAPIPAGPDDLAARDGVPAQKLAQFERGEVFANAPELLRPVTPTPPPPTPPAEAALPQPLAEESAPAAAPAVAAAAPTAMPTAPPAPLPMPPVAAPPAAAQEPAGAPAPPGANAGVPLIYELPLGTRQTLPALKMSMHVYSADTARRVVILDGERYQEGATVSGELRIAAITPDGVVLELGGQRFLLPRGGR